MQHTVADANPRMVQPKHTVTIEMPLDIADALIAKAGSMDDAVHEALSAYLKTDTKARNERIKAFVQKGSDIAKLAEFHGLTPEDILEIAHR
jgi:hypothetical protein